MDAILGPMIGRRIFHRFIKHALKRNESSAEVIGNALGGGPVLIKLRKPCICNRAAAQHKRLANDQFYFRQRFFRSFKQGIVIALVNLNRAFVIAGEGRRV